MIQIPIQITIYPSYHRKEQIKIYKYSQKISRSAKAKSPEQNKSQDLSMWSFKETEEGRLNSQYHSVTSRELEWSQIWAEILQRPKQMSEN